MSDVTENNGTKAPKERKTFSLMVRMTETERVLLEKKRTKAGVSAAELIRGLISDNEPVGRVTVEPNTLTLLTRFDNIANALMQIEMKDEMRDKMLRALLGLKMHIIPGVRQYQLNQKDSPMRDE